MKLETLKTLLSMIDFTLGINAPRPQSIIKKTETNVR